jgi:hypothetical protein
MKTGRVVTGHPVDVASGIVFTAGHDFTLGGSLELLWSRHYSTSSNVNSWLGRCWSTPYLMALERVPDGYQLTDEEGTTILFRFDGDDLPIGTVLADFGSNLELRRETHYFTMLH